MNSCCITSRASTSRRPPDRPRSPAALAASALRPAAARALPADPRIERPDSLGRRMGHRDGVPPARRWQRQFELPDLSIAINLSPPAAHAPAARRRGRRKSLAEHGARPGLHRARDRRRRHRAQARRTRSKRCVNCANSACASRSITSARATSRSNRSTTASSTASCSTSH